MSQPASSSVLPRRSGVAQRREHYVGVAQVQRQLGKVRPAAPRPRCSPWPARSAAAARARASRNGDQAPAASTTWPATNVSAGGDDAHAGRRAARGRATSAPVTTVAPASSASSATARVKRMRVQMAVLGEEERSGELAAQAGEDPAGLGGRHLVDARAEGARSFHVLARGREAGRGLEHLQLAVVVEEPAVAVPGGELVVQTRARHVQRTQYGSGRLRPLSRAGGPEQPEPARQEPGWAAERCRRGWSCRASS